MSYVLLNHLFCCRYLSYPCPKMKDNQGPSFKLKKQTIFCDLIPTPVKYNGYETWPNGQKQCKIETIMHLVCIKQFFFLPLKNKSLLKAGTCIDVASLYTI